MNTTPQDIVFEVAGLTLRGKRWGTPGLCPVLALHGWLDNCASFDFLAPQLTGVDLIALDLPGHGRSDHRPGLGAYNIWQDLGELLMIAEQLGWRRFGMLGHSRGAMIATLLTATFPEKITHLGLIESLLPPPVEAAEAPAQLASAITGLQTLWQRPRHYYKDFEAAVAARSQGIVPLPMADAQVLAARGVSSDEQGYYWGNDAKVMAPSEVKFTLDQLRGFLDCIAIPVQLVVAEQGLMAKSSLLSGLLDDYPNIHTHRLPGEHHLHMSPQATTIAKLLNSYYLDTSTSA